MVKAVSMFSGGLDSILAAKVLLELGVDVQVIHMVMPFGDRDKEHEHVRNLCAQIGAEPRFESRGESFFQMIRNPEHGYGKNMNPCIDCRIAMLKRAKEIMHEIGADFIATGEVVGQRPMSQRRDAMALIDKQADVKGMVVRPLCAKNLPPTDVEEKGLLDRDRLYDFSGRSRTPQMKLATHFGITDYPSPAGGCELTQPNFSVRLKHLFSMKENTVADDWSLLSFGRHISLGPEKKAIISRNESENGRLLQLQNGCDGIFEPLNFPGPTAFIVGPHDIRDIENVGAMMLRYGKNPKDQSIAQIKYKGTAGEKTLDIPDPATDDLITPNLIC